MSTGLGARVRSTAERLLPAPMFRWSHRAWELLRRTAPWRIIASARHRRLNRGLAEDEIVLRPGLMLRIDPVSRSSFEWFCFRSRNMVEEFDAFLRLARGRTRFLDVGAFQGIFALAFARQADARALALEPATGAFAVLVENVRRSASQVTPLQIAASATERAIVMERDWEHLRAVPAGQGVETIEVPGRALDGLCASLEFVPDLVKIDVEGFEMDVLLGAAAVLSRRGVALLLEVHPRLLRRLGQSPGELFDLLISYGLVPRELSGTALSRQEFSRVEQDCRILADSSPP